ncbi:hypothetical protein AYI70_g11294 [Smittium culicis]|uniref:Uncharacterized protein n=1 Tax=Smittium culicis TaxID=133412 RepID=A0A1R1X2E8_9FUNG|nr:hypothetical protein AYI70_g11294 [Smittium culicis]
MLSWPLLPVSSPNIRAITEHVDHHQDTQLSYKMAQELSSVHTKLIGIDSDAGENGNPESVHLEESVNGKER